MVASIEKDRKNRMNPGGSCGSARLSAPECEAEGTGLEPATAEPRLISNQLPNHSVTLQNQRKTDFSETRYTVDYTSEP